MFNCVEQEFSADRVVTHQPRMRCARRVSTNDLTPVHAAKPLLTHQSFNRAADHRRDTFTAHLLPDLVCAIDLPIRALSYSCSPLVTIARTRIHFSLLDAFQQGLWHTTDLGAMDSRQPTQGWALPAVLLHHAYSAFTHFWWKTFRFLTHGSIFSKFGASTIPGGDSTHSRCFFCVPNKINNAKKD